MQNSKIKLNWLDNSRVVSHAIALERGVFLLLSSGEKKASAGCVLDPATASALAKEPGALVEEAKRRWPSEPRIQYRLIGDARQIAALSAALARSGLQAGTPAELALPTELHYFPAESRVRARKSGAQAPTVAQTAAPARAPGKTRVLVIDDSDTICKLLSRIVAEDPELECVGTVSRPSQAQAAVAQLKPDVITMDIHMPEMDGVALLKQLLPLHQIPVVMISSLNREEGGAVLDALDAGAVDYIQKPTLDRLAETAPMIREKIKMARGARVNHGSARRRPNATVLSQFRSQIDQSQLILIGSSTGGTEALRQVLTALPDGVPPILIVQHIPPVFSAAFAERMNQLCKFKVREAQDGDRVTPDLCLIAPGGKQMKVKRHADGDLRVVIEDSPPVNRHKPSVDYLFSSVAELKPRKMIGAILTGMGADGAKGLLELKKLGAHTIAQDEATSVVFGMPREAIKLGAADEVLPLDKIAERILVAAKKKSAAA